MSRNGMRCLLLGLLLPWTPQIWSIITGNIKLHVNAFSLQAPSNPKLPASSTLPDEQETPLVQRVAIIGTGIAGLTLAHALESSSESKKTFTNIETHLFDSRPTLDFEAGAGIQLSGGMSVLHQINPDLYHAVAKAACPVTHIRSRAKPWGTAESSSSSSVQNKYTRLIDLNLKQEVQKAGAEGELMVNGQLSWFAIMRGALQRVLLEELSKETRKRVQLGMELTGIKAGASKEDDPKTEGIMCQFANGETQGPFDLVIGCDGINSAVKEYVETGRIEQTSTTKKSKSSIYSGIRIVYAVYDGDAENTEQNNKNVELKQYFGDGLYSLVGTYGTGEGKPVKQTGYLILRDENYIGPFKKQKKNEDENQEKQQGSNQDGEDAEDENVSWIPDTRAPANARSFCLDQIAKAQVPPTEIQAVIEKANVFFQAGVYYHNPFRFQGWKREVKDSGGRFCVLAGDAAHAMPPFLGQGANQAVQDGFCLGKKILEHNERLEMLEKEEKKFPQLDVEEGEEVDEEKERTFKELLNDYECIRWSPTASITLKSVLLGYLETGGEGFQSTLRDIVFLVLGKLGIASKILLDGAKPRV